MSHPQRAPHPFRITKAEKPVFDALLSQVRANPDKLDVIRQAVADTERLTGGAHVVGHTFVSPAAALRVVRDLLRVQLRPARMLLFGSHARGTADEWSDFDILLVFDDERAASLTTEDIWRPLQGLGVPVDLVALSASEFERDRHVEGSFAHQADQEGIVLYERR